MLLHEKIQLMRTLKGWSQEEMAEKLSMSVSGYAKIERGATDITMSRLKSISEVLGVQLQDLFSQSGKVLINLGEIHGLNYSYIDTCNITESEKELAHKIESLELIVKQQTKEIDYLKNIIELMKSK
ncbi:putative transcription factor, MBF1 like protein [Beggiatoa alba B18LD]|uniref:Putative transcription factor, MBF1 like protein n=1 Tax=Beggiatoa alba B18LD TaxID=395493 RepID=I3CKM6_9GAMM|nr:helix-turn-helix transcriptional regulator [Beggiatoa alba]EIJ44169.1 putative transcription factor, MBF1 like protein [Beggiatoa alba B18LD]